jgi:hypothetical protein
VGVFAFGDRKLNGTSRSIFRHLRRIVVGPFEQAIQIKFRNNLMSQLVAVAGPASQIVSSDIG